MKGIYLLFQNIHSKKLLCIYYDCFCPSFRSLVRCQCGIILQTKIDMYCISKWMRDIRITKQSQKQSPLLYKSQFYFFEQRKEIVVSGNNNLEIGKEEEESVRLLSARHMCFRLRRC